MSGRAWIDGYTVEDELRSNGHGRTARGRSQTDGAQVLLKVMLPAGGEQHVEDRRSTTLRRLERLQRLAPPGLAGVIQASPYGDGVLAVTDWIEGQPLESLIGAGSLPLDEGIGVLAAVAATLDAMHESRLVHHSLKPSNVICAAGGPVLTDAVVLEGCASAMMRSEPPWERAQFAAPEQILGLGQSAASNRYAFGLLAYRTLTGRLPFDSSSSIDFLYATLYASPTPICTLRPDLPESLDTVFRRVLAPEPSERHATCGEVVDDLLRQLQPTASATEEVLEPMAWHAAASLASAWESERPVGGRPRALAQRPAEPASPPPAVAAAAAALRSAWQSERPIGGVRAAAPIPPQDLDSAPVVTAARSPRSASRPAATMAAPIPPPAEVPAPPRRRGALHAVRDWIAILRASPSGPRDLLQREAYLNEWEGDVADPENPSAQLPRWRMNIVVSRPGCTVRVDDEERGAPPLEIELRGRAGQAVQLEVLDAESRILAARVVRLHPLMDKTWEPEIVAPALPFKREA